LRRLPIARRDTGRRAWERRDPEQFLMRQRGRCFARQLVTHGDGIGIERERR